jgi:hypothetical protein
LGHGVGPPDGDINLDIARAGWARRRPIELHAKRVSKAGFCATTRARTGPQGSTAGNDLPPRLRAA